jgi:hypothetical protein
MCAGDAKRAEAIADALHNAPRLGAFRNDATTSNPYACRAARLLGERIVLAVRGHYRAGAPRL